MLHLIQKSPFSSSALEDCLGVAQAGDSILLMQDGVYGVMQPDIPDTLSIFALEQDLAARGLLNSEHWACNTNINIITIEHFVELTTKHDHTISWF